MTKTRHKSCVPAMYMMSLPLLNRASVAQFPGLNFRFTAVNKQCLFICQNKYNVILLIRQDPGGLQMTTYPADDIVDISVSSARALLVRSRNVTWFCIQISWTMGFHIIFLSKNYRPQ